MRDLTTLLTLLMVRLDSNRLQTGTRPPVIGAADTGGISADVDAKIFMSAHLYHSSMPSVPCQHWRDRENLIIHICGALQYLNKNIYQK